MLVIFYSGLGLRRAMEKKKTRPWLFSLKTETTVKTKTINRKLAFRLTR